MSTFRIHNLFAVIACCFAWSLIGANTCQAQLPRDVQDMFEAMLEDLDDDLRQKFQQAIDNDTATVEFTAEQFLRFRDDPINPFEGLERIKVDEGGGNIALKFELPSLRNRAVDMRERQSPAILDALSAQVQTVVPSTVAIMSGKRQIALGTVVDSNGLIATKSSELKKRKYLKVVTSDARDFDAEIVYSDDEYDIAFVKVDTELQPITWNQPSALPGAFLILPAPNGKAFAMGTMSVTARSTSIGEQAKLGVDPDEVPGGIKVSRIESGEPSFKAGLRDGDIITSIDGAPIRTVAQLVKAIRLKGPGRTIRINYLRNGNSIDTEATLGTLEVSGQQAQRFKMMSRLGAIPSKRAGNFPLVFQHDAPLFPEQCGGPVTDFDGNVIGINIARAGRASTYAVPLEQLQQLVQQYIRQSVAERNNRFSPTIPQ